ncbi:MAG: hypothetical protein J6A37_05175, partial [Oscillospiraceae bacterium]|nr:hypothetical protein [Oscillospiraceae bacterium]
ALQDYDHKTRRTGGKLMKMKKKTIKTIGITAGVIAAVGAGVTAICLAVKKKNKPDAEIPYPASAWDTK